MRLGGRTITPPAPLIVPFIRPPKPVQNADGTISEINDDLIFHVGVVLNYDEFEKLCPLPKPPPIMYKGGKQGKDFNNKDYLAALNEWSVYRTLWMMLKSLEPTPDLHWDSVDMNDPKTWKNFLIELATDGGMTVQQINHLQAQIMNVNSINEEKMEEARKVFSVGRQDSAD